MDKCNDLRAAWAREAAAYVAARLPEPPRTGVILGSGLGGIAERIESPTVIPYREIPHFACSTAPGHAGRLVAGRLGGRPVVCMQGRLHRYEGHEMADIIFPIRVMKLLGVQTLIVTNAAGGINTGFQVGDLMLIADHINLMGTNPLIGPNEEAFGPRFPDMTAVYSPRLREKALAAAERRNIPLKQGVYLQTTGPQYETPAEIRMFRAMGGDAVGNMGKRGRQICGKYTANERKG